MKNITLNVSKGNISTEIKTIFKYYLLSEYIS